MTKETVIVVVVRLLLLCEWARMRNSETFHTSIYFFWTHYSLQPQGQWASSSTTFHPKVHVSIFPHSAMMTVPLTIQLINIHTSMSALKAIRNDALQGQGWISTATNAPVASGRDRNMQTCTSCPVGRPRQLNLRDSGTIPSLLAMCW